MKQKSIIDKSADKCIFEIINIIEANYKANDIVKKAIKKKIWKMVDQIKKDFYCKNFD